MRRGRGPSAMIWVALAVAAVVCDEMIATHP
jgi:hypothetical protein